MNRNSVSFIKRRRQVMHQKIILSLLIFAIIMCCFFVFSGFMTSAHDKQKTIPTKTSYISIQIESGDSLWSIAEEYKPVNMSIKDYINELVHLNALKSDDIHADQFLTVPCYEIKLM